MNTNRNWDRANFRANVIFGVIFTILGLAAIFISLIPYIFPHSR